MWEDEMRVIGLKSDLGLSGEGRGSIDVTGCLILDDSDWKLIKMDIDDARRNCLSPSGKDRLRYYDLWDEALDILDEQNVNFLYMRNA